MDKAQVARIRHYYLQIGDYICEDGNLIGIDDEFPEKLTFPVSAVVFHIGRNEADKSDYSRTGMTKDSQTGATNVHGYAIAVAPAGNARVGVIAGNGAAVIPNEFTLVNGLSATWGDTTILKKLLKRPEESLL